MTTFPPALQGLIDAFRRYLPGVGPKTAERYALALAKDKNGNARELARAIAAMKQAMQICAICYTLADRTPCAICTDRSRTPGLLCVIAEPQDMLAIERTGAFKGRYHVLGGLLSPIEGITPKHIHLDALVRRVLTEKITEVIVAFDGTMDGEATALHLKHALAELPVRLTRLARGLPMGSDIEYADDITLTDALKGRNDV